MDSKSKFILESERLILREIDIERDFEPWVEMMSDAETVRFIGGETLGRAACWRHIAMLVGHQTIWGYGFYSVIEKATGDWVGRVGHWNPEGWTEPEIGWAIHPGHTRKGYAKEAGAACVDYAFDTLGWTRAVHVVGAKNIASIKTAEAIGSKRLYHIDNLPPFGTVDCWAYGQEKP